MYWTAITNKGDDFMPLEAFRRKRGDARQAGKSKVKKNTSDTLDGDHLYWTLKFKRRSNVDYSFGNLVKKSSASLNDDAGLFHSIFS